MGIHLWSIAFSKAFGTLQLRPGVCQSDAGAQKGHCLFDDLQVAVAEDRPVGDGVFRFDLLPPLPVHTRHVYKITFSAKVDMNAAISCRFQRSASAETTLFTSAAASADGEALGFWGGTKRLAGKWHNQVCSCVGHYMCVV